MGQRQPDFRRVQSLPVWEEWIEMPGRGAGADLGGSLPVWEEWIEIRCCRIPSGRSGSLPVWEEWIEIGGDGGLGSGSGVSSRMGRVD